MIQTQHTERSGTFLYSNGEAAERKIKEPLLFIIAQKGIRYLGINLTKEAKNLYSENCKTLIKEIEDDTKRWKTIACS